MRIKQLLALLLGFLSLYSCRLKEAHEWDTEMLTPIGKGELNINNILTDTLIKKDADNELQLVYVQDLKSIGIGSLLHVKDTTLPKTVNLKQISLGQRDLQRDITLGEVARNAGFTGQLIILNQGNYMVIPAMSNITTGDVDINATSFFETATFIDGKLKLEVHNGFPVELTDIQFRLRNKNDKAVIVNDTITSLMPGASFVKEYSLKGKTVEGNLQAAIINMNSPGSNGKKVLIDTNDAISLRISAYDMQVSTATAVFPAQNVVDDKAEVPYDLGDAQLVFMRIRSGEIRVVAQHTIPDSLYLTYDIPNAIRFGKSLHVFSVVPPALPGQSSYSSQTVPIQDYEVDLTGEKHDTVNTFFNTLKVRIDSTGHLETLSLSDSIYIKYGIYDVIPAYARGYLGQQEFNIGPEQMNFDFLNKVTAGELSLADLKVSLDISNGMGLPGQIRLDELKAINTRTGKSKVMTGSIMSQPIDVAPATDKPLTPSITSIKLDASNSNIKELLELLPDKFEYKLVVKTNPEGKKGYDEFVYYESQIKASLNMEVPMDFGAKGLTLQDTIPINTTTNVDLNKISRATFYIQMENTFPFDMNLQLYILDKQGKIVDSLLQAGQNTMVAAQLEYPSLQVAAPTVSRLVANVSEMQWQKLLESHSLVLKAVLDTKPPGNHYKIYSTYGLKTKISASFDYRAKF